MMKDRGGGSSVVGGSIDRKRINDALDKHLERSSSRFLSSSSHNNNNNNKDKEVLSVSVSKRDTRTTSSSILSSKIKSSDGLFCFPPLLSLINILLCLSISMISNTLTLSYSTGCFIIIIHFTTCFSFKVTDYDKLYT